MPQHCDVIWLREMHPAHARKSTPKQGMEGVYISWPVQAVPGRFGPAPGLARFGSVQVQPAEQDAPTSFAIAVPLMFQVFGTLLIHAHVLPHIGLGPPASQQMRDTIFGNHS